MAQVTLRDVKKVYDGKVVAVRDVNLPIGAGEFLVLAGAVEAPVLDRGAQVLVDQDEFHHLILEPVPPPPYQKLALHLVLTVLHQPFHK